MDFLTILLNEALNYSGYVALASIPLMFYLAGKKEEHYKDIVKHYLKQIDEMKKKNEQVFEELSEQNRDLTNRYLEDLKEAMEEFIRFQREMHDLAYKTNLELKELNETVVQQNKIIYQDQNEIAKRDAIIQRKTQQIARLKEGR